jgi:glutaredoxin
MKKVVLYSMKNCTHCQTAKTYLEQQNIKYRLCDVQSPAGKKEFYKLGVRSVPVLKIGDQLLLGFSPNKFNELYQ